jgi:hypothetical protein
VPLLEHEDVDDLSEQSCRALFETLAAQDPGLTEFEQQLRETGCRGRGDAASESFGNVVSMRRRVRP